MRTPRATPHYLSLDEISPVVDLASCWHYENDTQHEYRIPSFHLMLIESGLLVNQAPRRCFEAGPGDFICLPPSEYSRYGTRGSTVYYQTHVAFAAPPRHQLGPWLDGIGPLPLHLPMRDHFPAMRQVFETLCIELAQAGPASQLRVRAAIHEILALIITASKPRSPVIRRLDDWQRARLRLSSEWGGPLKIEDLAAQAGVSTDHFIRQYKQRFGTSPKVYQTHARLREAVRLLRSTEKSAKTIAYELGFADPKSFFRLFKKHLGVVPSDLRLSGKMKYLLRPARGKSLFPINEHIFPAGPGPKVETKFRLRKYQPVRR